MAKVLKDEDMGIIISSIHKYINDYYNSDLIDYYDVFGIDRHLSSEEIVKYLVKKRFHIIFHADLIYNVPEHLQPYYQNICDAAKQFRHIMETPHQRQEYDQKLAERNDIFEKTVYAANAIDDVEAQRIKASKERIFEMFGKFVLPTIAKYGKELSISAIKDYLNLGFLKSFTRNQDCRDKISYVDRTTLLELVNSAYNVESYGEAAPLLFDDIIAHSCELVESAALATYKKYGYAQSKGALKHFIMENRITFFTNTGGARDKLVGSEITSVTLPYLLAYELNLEDYINFPSDTRINNGYVINEYMKTIEQKIMQNSSVSYKPN